MRTLRSQHILGASLFAAVVAVVICRNAASAQPLLTGPFRVHLGVDLPLQPVGATRVIAGVTFPSVLISSTIRLGPWIGLIRQDTLGIPLVGARGQWGVYQPNLESPVGEIAITASYAYGINTASGNGLLKHRFSIGVSRVLGDGIFAGVDVVGSIASPLQPYIGFSLGMAIPTGDPIINRTEIVAQSEDRSGNANAPSVDMLYECITYARIRGIVDSCKKMDPASMGNLAQSLRNNPIEWEKIARISELLDVLENRQYGCIVHAVNSVMSDILNQYPHLKKSLSEKRRDEIFIRIIKGVLESL